MERRHIRVGLIGFGEIGSAIGAGLREEGLENVSAYDIAAFEDAESPLIQGRARSAGVRLVRTPAELAEAADYVIAAVPGSDTLDAAEAIAASLRPSHVYADIASATPKVKQAVGAALLASGAQIADGGIMGSPHQDGHTIPILASGPGARAFHDAFVPWGMRIEVVGAELGAGSGIKIIRSVVMKGIEALCIECGLASSRYGIHDEVFESIAKWIDQRSFLETMTFFLRTDAIHAARRAEEAAMSADALEEVGIEPVMTRSTVALLQRTADMGLREAFGGVVPDDYKTVIAALDRGLQAALQEKNAASKATARGATFTSMST
jgi:3-hydroxyisobutyrate dehydrogenase-like beta-hydroxyacid dehydrogenase